MHTVSHLHLTSLFITFHSKCGIDIGLIKGEAQQISDGHGAEGVMRPTPLTYILLLNTINEKHTFQNYWLFSV
jgi:hypothetical protein